MSLLEKAGLAILHRLNPETAHSLSLRALNARLLPLPGPVTSARLTTQLAGLTLPNPVGLAAGFDKNATAIAPLARAGFGYLELGAVTPLPQPGNPKPRLFRLTPDRAAINRFGFNNDGMHTIAARLANHCASIPVGLNLGANKDSADRIVDFCTVLETCAPHLDFATINVSSPNTEHLRDLQGKAALSQLLQAVLKTRDSLNTHIPIFLKIAPDLAENHLTDIAQVALSVRIDAIIATNTTLARDGLTSPHRSQSGGLSGAPLFEKSTRILAQLSDITGGKLPLIGVGGITDAQDVLEKLKAGATAIQLYTAMVFKGISLAATIARDLDTLLARDGISNVSEITGTETGKWL